MSRPARWVRCAGRTLLGRQCRRQKWTSADSWLCFEHVADEDTILDLDQETTP